MKITFDGETVQDSRYDLLKTYEDLYLPVKERENRLIYGISSVNMRKLRINAGVKVTSLPSQVSLATIHNTKYCIRLNYPILTDHGVVYPIHLE